MADNLVVLNVPEVAAALEKAAETLRPAFERATRKWLLKRVGDLARYPAPPAGSNYRRTGTLGRTWTTAVPQFTATASGFEAKLGNATPYGPYVQGERQAKVHAGRWGTAEAIAQAAKPELEGDLRVEVAAIEAQINGTTA